MILLPLRERWLGGSVARHRMPRGATGCVGTSRSLPAAPSPGFAAVSVARGSLRRVQYGLRRAVRPPLRILAAGHRRGGREVSRLRHRRARLRPRALWCVQAKSICSRSRASAATSVRVAMRSAWRFGVCGWRRPCSRTYHTGRWCLRYQSGSGRTCSTTAPCLATCRGLPRAPSPRSSARPWVSGVSRSVS